MGEAGSVFEGINNYQDLSKNLWNHRFPGAAYGRNKFEIRNSNIEQGISNDKAFLSFGVHYSLFDIQYSLSNGKNSML